MKNTIKDHINTKILHNTPGKAFLNLILIVALVLLAFYIGSIIIIPLVLVITVFSILFLIIAGLSTAILSPIILISYLFCKRRKKYVQQCKINKTITR